MVAGAFSPIPRVPLPWRGGVYFLLLYIWVGSVTITGSVTIACTKPIIRWYTWLSLAYQLQESCNVLRSPMWTLLSSRCAHSLYRLPSWSSSQAQPIPILSRCPLESQQDGVSSNLQKLPNIRRAGNSAEACYIIPVHQKDADGEAFQAETTVPFWSKTRTLSWGQGAHTKIPHILQVVG